MELEQLKNRVDWLDDERRKDKNLIAQLEEKIVSLEKNISSYQHDNSQLSTEITQLKMIIGRMDSFDNSLIQQRSEIHRQLKDQERTIAQGDQEILNILRAEIHNYDKPIADLRKEVEVARNLNRDMQARVAEDIRLSRLIEELGKNLDDLRRSEEEQTRIYRLIEDGRRQDSNRLTDIQGEVTALRKRSDEHRGRIDVSEIEFKKLETRLNELVNAEKDRSDAQAIFQEKQALIAVERDAAWKEWENRFKTIEKQSIDIENQLQSLDSTFLTVKRTQDAVDDLMQRVERRINEVAEIQRLAEERFRQEWTTFKADDQKRWTNYTLSQDEQRGEIGRRFDRINERVTYIEDSLQEIQDMLQYVNELNNSNLQSILAAFNDWVTGYERTQGTTR